MKKRSAVQGAVFISIGILIAGFAFGWLDMSDFSGGWWAFFLFLPAAVKLLTDGMNAAALFFASLGIMLFLLGNGRISGGTLVLYIVPVILVIWGISLIYKSLFPVPADIGNSAKLKAGRWIAGILLSFIFLGLLSFSLLKLEGKEQGDAVEYSEFYEEFANIEKMEIDIDHIDLTIVPGTVFSVGSDSLPSDCEVYFEDGTLHIQSVHETDLLAFIDFHWFSNEDKPLVQVVVTMPEGSHLKEWNAALENSAVKVDGLQSDHLEFRFGSGSAVFENCEVLNAEIHSGSGSIRFERSRTAGIDLSSGSGSFRYEGSLTGRNVIDSGSGDVSMILEGDIEAYYIKASVGSGGVWLNGVRVEDTEMGRKSAENQFDIDVGSGRVTIDIE